MTAGKFGRIAVEERRIETDDVEPFFHSRLGARFVTLVEQIWHVGDVLCHGHVRKEDAALDGVADVAAQLDLVHVANVFAIDAHAATVRGEQTVDELESGGLAAAGRTDDGDKIALVDTQAQVFEHSLIAVGFMYMIKFNEGFHGVLLIVTDFVPEENRGRHRGARARRSQRRCSSQPCRRR